MGQLENKTAVVTGGSSGIGLAVAQRLAAEGAHVFITGRSEVGLAGAVATIRTATAVQGDIANLADLDRLYDAVGARGDGLDILFANAGAAGFASLADTTAEHLDEILGVNLRGTLFTVQKALPLLNVGASVIINSSVRADDGLEGFGTYAASKAALRSYTRTWANELKARNIRVNAVSPGTIDTPAISGFVPVDKVAAVRRNFAAKVPIGRMGTAEEVAAAVAFLASDQSSFVIGANLYVDGGENQV